MKGKRTPSDFKEKMEKFPNPNTENQEFLPFEMGYLPENFQKKAAAELNEDPECQKEKLKELKQLLKEDKDTKDLIFIDNFLIQFLRVKKHDAEKAFHQIKSFIALREKNQDMFIDLNFNSLVRTIDDEIMYVLPWRCPDGCAVIIVEVNNWDPDLFPVEDLRRAFVTYFLGSLQDPMTQVNGVKMVFDIKSNKIKHLKYVTPHNLYLLYHAAQNVCPLRYKEVHLVNDSFTARTAWAVIKHFLSDKIRNRVTFHKNSKTLSNHIPRAILPKHLGGDLEKYHMTDWLKRTLASENIAIITGIRNWSSKN